MSTRSIWIDDSDDRIIYYGPNWVFKQTPGIATSYGHSLNVTFHETTSDGGIAFTFKKASRVEILGNNDSWDKQEAPLWRCTLDGQIGGVPSEAPEGCETSFFSYCGFEIPDGGEHQLTLNATVPAGSTFNIGGINIIPTEEVFEREILEIQDDDVAIKYYPGSSWMITKSGTHETDVPGSFLQFNFTGSAVQFIAIPAANKTASSGRYTINNGPPKDFTIPGLLDAKPFGHTLFVEEGLVPTNHTLNITFTGQLGQAPLSVSSFRVILPGASPRYFKPRKAPLGGVIGGIIGLIILIVLFCVFFWRRHHHRKKDGPAPSVTPYTEFKPQAASLAPTQSADIESRLLVSSVKQSPMPIVLVHDRSRVEVLHEDSGYRVRDTGSNGQAWFTDRSVDIREIPPMYSPL